MDNCIFCQIVKKASPASIEFENDSVMAFKSIAPVSKHHILIVPKVHLETIFDFKDQNKDFFFEMIKVAKELVERKKIKSGYKLVINGGKYQSMPHFHWHLLGGKLEDENNVLNKT